MAQRAYPAIGRRIKLSQGTAAEEISSNHFEAGRTVEAAGRNPDVGERCRLEEQRCLLTSSATYRR